MTKPSYEELERRVGELEKQALERVQFKKVLRDRERTTRAILDNAVQFIGIVSTDGILMDLNRPSLQFAGVKKSEVLGKPFWETPWWTHSPELQEKLRNGIRAATRGEFVRFETNHIGADGKVMIGDFTINPVKDETGKVVLLIPEARDITDQKKAERALRQSENTARALLNAPTESAVLIDTRCTVLAINETGARQLSRPAHEIIGRNIFDFLPADMAASRKSRVLEAIQGAKRVRFEDEHNGRSYDHNIYPILNKEGPPGRVAMYSHDITDFKQAQARVQERTAALIESEEKYRTLVENLPLVVYRLSTKGDVLFVNHFVEDIFGYTPGELYRDSDLWYKKVFRADRAKNKAFREKCLLMGKEVVFEYRVKHKKGHTVYVMDHTIPFLSDSGVVTSADGIIMDVTRRVRLQEKLVQAEGHKTVTEISTRLAHEIRNPLMSAGGFARRLLSSMPPDDPNRNKVEIIVQEVSRLEAILRMILNYIQPIDIDLSPVEPNRLVESVARAVDTKIEEKNLRIDLQLIPGLPKIAADSSHMEEVLLTLLTNAIHQMVSGATLTVSTCEANGLFKLMMHYVVEQISTDDAKDIFYPFTTSSMIADTIDISTSRAIVHRHGGTLNGRIEGSGEFTIEMTLPFWEEDK